MGTISIGDHSDYDRFSAARPPASGRFWKDPVFDYPGGMARRLSIVAATLALMLACSQNGPTTPDSPTQAVVVAFGDSLTSGPGLAPNETYPARLQERIRAAGMPHVVVNEGVFGDTTTDGVRRLDRALGHGPRVLIVAFGANDGLAGVPIDTVRRNLVTIIERARERQVRVLLCGMEAPPTHGLDYSLQFHNIYPDLAQRYAAPLMPFLLADVLGRPDLNLEDGFHPNAAGARRIADNMWPYLEPLLR
jgi:acyl-CoA thioesterase-1